MNRHRIILAAVCLVLLSRTAYSDPPRDIQVKVSKEQMDISVTHPTKAPGAHYVKRIVVNLNGIKVMDQAFKEQQTKDLQETTLNLTSLKKGDKVSIEAFCSNYGNLKKNATIG